MKHHLKEKAIKLRKDGLSYSEILKTIPVAKSTLSLWLRSVGLSKKQKQRLTEKKLQSIKKGWETRRNQRIESTKLIKDKAHKDIDVVNKRDLWLMGIMLYWGEGSKEKDYKPGQGLVFSNSDPLMIKIFLKWLKMIGVHESRIEFQIYIHENYNSRKTEVQKYWTSVAGFSMSKFDKIYFKKNKINTTRKNKGKDYYGLLRIRVRKSTNLYRKIAGWTEGICMKCGVV